MPGNDNARPQLEPSIPKYLQIADYFREQIENGQLPPGAEIDSERVIAETFGVSRPTATRAIAALRQWNLVSSQPGLGTFVRAATAIRSEEADDELAARLAQLEKRLAEIPPDLPVQIEQLQRSVGILQAQMVELRDRIGLEWKADPAPTTGRRFPGRRP
jgi:DNA-binding transcriptional regulator YhcF (GntR family)